MIDRRWEVRRRTGPAATLHQPAEPGDQQPTVDVLTVDGPALVLGSSQREEVVDRARAEALGIGIARRRSGGGAVLLVPGDHVWIDLWLPSSDPLWDDDVIRAADWVGATWAAVATTLGLGPVTVHRDNATTDRWSALVCFAGAGPGEVFVDGRKLVGVSQRRTRAWARFQCVVHRRWDAATTVALLAAPERGSGAASLAGRVAEIGSADVEAALLEALPTR